jgi:hypothetical protein
MSNGAGPYIPNLSTSITLPEGWYFIGAQGNQNNAQRVSAEAVLAWIEENLSTDISLETYYAAPSATGFTAALPDTSDNYWLVLTPTGTFADGEIVLPDVSACVDHQTVQVNCTQIVTTLAVDGNGATVTGAPTTLAAANGFFTLRFDAVTSTWYRVS